MTAKVGILAIIIPLSFLQNPFVVATSRNSGPTPAAAAAAAVASPLLGLSEWIRTVKFGSDVDDGSAVKGASPLSIWVYQGALYDLLSGQHVADVRGVELIRPLAQYDSSSSSTSSTSVSSNRDENINQKQQQQQQQRQESFLGKCKDLHVAKAMREYWENTKHNEDAVDVTTFTSRKFFCYQSPVEDSDDPAIASSPSPSRNLLDSIRLRPTAPRRKVPPFQAMASYDTVISYLTPSSRRHQHDDNHQNNHRINNNKPKSLVLLHTEWPNRNSVHGLAQVRQSQPTSLDLNIYTRASASTKQQQQSLNLPSLLLSKTSTEGQADNSDNKNSTTAFQPPARHVKRSSLIQFGLSPASTLNRYGARETYSYQILPISSSFIGDNDDDSSSPTTFIPTPRSSKRAWFSSKSVEPASATSSNTTTTTASVRYTRQGEGPPWYGPHRLCTLELQGQRFNHETELETYFSRQEQKQQQQQQQQTQGGVTSLCRNWAQSALAEWKNNRDSDNDDDEYNNWIERFRQQPSDRDAVVRHLLKQQQQQPYTDDEHHSWQRVATKLQSYWQRLSSSLSTSSTPSPQHHLLDNDDNR